MAVLLLGEDQSISVSVPKSWLPKGVKEGIYLQSDFRIDNEATEHARADVQSLLDSMPNDP